MSSTDQTHIEKKFIKYHMNNPAVWSEFKRYAFEAIAAGRTTYSARYIIHKIRWDSVIETNKELSFKISDHASPYYARLFHSAYPAHKGLFQVLTQGSDFETPTVEPVQVEMAL